MSTIYNNLLDLNRQSLKNKIDKLDKYLDNYPASDLIQILSNSVERDKRIISDFTADEVILHSVKRDKTIRKIRYLTPKGVARYLLEGDIFSYENACYIFNVPIVNKQHILWHGQLMKCLYTDVNDTDVNDTDVNDTDTVTGKDNSVDLSKDKVCKLIFQVKPLLKWLFEKRKSIKMLGDNAYQMDLYDVVVNMAEINNEKLEYFKQFKLD